LAKKVIADLRDCSDEEDEISVYTVYNDKRKLK